MNGHAAQQGIQRVFRRIQHLVQYGRTTTAVDDTGAIQAVQVRTNGLTLKDKVKVVSIFGFESSMPVGTDVVTVGVSGDPSNSVIIAANNIASRLKGLISGESRMFNSFGHFVRLGKTGLMVQAVDQPITIATANNVTIQCPGHVITINGTSLTITAMTTITGDTRIEGNLAVIGNITATGSITGDV